MGDSLKKQVFVKVVASIIFAVICWFTGLLPWIWGKGLVLFSAVWYWLSTSHEIQLSLLGWQMMFAILIFVFSVFHLFAWFWKRSSFYKKSYKRYSRDIFFGAIWTWDYFCGFPINIWCECPNCSTTLVYSEDYVREYDCYRTVVSCENCGFRIQPQDGEKDYLVSKVGRQIERKLKTQEYLKVIEKLLN